MDPDVEERLRAQYRARLARPSLLRALMMPFLVLGVMALAIYASVKFGNFGAGLVFLLLPFWRSFIFKGPQLSPGQMREEQEAYQASLPPIQRSLTLIETWVGIALMLMGVPLTSRILVGGHDLEGMGMIVIWMVALFINFALLAGLLAFQSGFLGANYRARIALLALPAVVAMLSMAPSIHWPPWGADKSDASAAAAAALMLKAFGKSDVAALEQALAQGADANAPDSARQSPLVKARQAVDAPTRLQMVQLLLDHGADANRPDADGDYPLLSGEPDTDIIDLLIRRGADSNVCDAEGNTLWRHIASLDADSIIEFSQQLPVAFGVPKQKDRTPCGGPLHAYGNHEDALKLLIYFADHGYDLRARDERGRLPLHLAAAGTHPEAVRFFLKRGVPVDARQDDGKTALMLANTSQEIVTMLLSAGADVHATADFNGSPMHVDGWHQLRQSPPEIISLLRAAQAEAPAPAPAHAPD